MNDNRKFLRRDLINLMSELLFLLLEITCVDRHTHTHTHTRTRARAHTHIHVHKLAESRIFSVTLYFCQTSTWNSSLIPKTKKLMQQAKNINY